MPGRETTSAGVPEVARPAVNWRVCFCLTPGPRHKPCQGAWSQPPAGYMNRQPMTDPESAALDTRRRRLLFRATHRGTYENDLMIGGFVRDRLATFDAA